jgi:23S rRNA G2445 N2-methylase RlmL
MSRQRRADKAVPPYYAFTMPGMESIAADEITAHLGAEIKKAARGVVVFRTDDISPEVLRLRTVEDVFVLAWGSDTLSYRAADLDLIRKWTAHRADWDQLLRIHHAIRPKPKGKPTYRLVAQMTGEHGYRRVDALKALERGLAGKLPASWRTAEDNAAVEIWLTIQGDMAVCGLRLSDRTMRHRKYKLEHLPASLRPTVAAAMVRVAECRPGHTVLDPMCGAGTILAECAAGGGRRRESGMNLVGGDMDLEALRAARTNLRTFVDEPRLCRWDARRLPLACESVDRIASNPPFGRRLGLPEETADLYREMVKEYDRVLRPNGRAAILVSDIRVLREAALRQQWKQEGQWRLRLLGHPSVLTVWRKPATMTILQ